MSPISITSLRRLTLALIALLFTAFALGSIASAQAEDFRIDRSVYRVQISGTYTKTWQGQTSAFPDPYTPWSVETGTTVSKWSLPGRGIKFEGSEFIGDLPGSTPLPKFQFGATRWVIAKAKNKSKFNRKINYYEGCGGELGECTGKERQGVEADSGSCTVDGKIPIDMDYDDSGRNPRIVFTYGQHRTMTDFCGKKHRDDDDTIDETPKAVWANGLEDIRKMKVGETQDQSNKSERGWVGGDGHPKGTRHVKPCPAMNGVGSRYCRATEFKVKVTRIK